MPVESSKNTTTSNISEAALPASVSNTSALLSALKTQLFDQRPAAVVYAQLAEHVYRGPDIIKDTALSELPLIADEAWQVVDTEHNPATAYFGALYAHHVTRQLVLVHRGTDSIRAWLEDFQRIVHENLGGQQTDALALTVRAVERARAEGYQLSFSGHSLGAWLAEHSLFYCFRVLDYPHVHAVTFESPGSQAMVERHLQSHREEMRVLLSKLDLTEYVSYPNVINTYSPHWGSLYQLSPDLQETRWQNRLFRPIDTSYTAQTHAIAGQIEALRADRGRYMEDWPAHNAQEDFFKAAEKVLSSEGTYQYKTELQAGLSTDLAFRLYFGSHYAELAQLSDAKCLPLRHYRLALEDFIEMFYKRHLKPIRESSEPDTAHTLQNALAVSLQQQGVEDESIRQALLGYSIKSIEGRALVYVEVDEALGDASVFRARLSAYFYEHPDQLALLTCKELTRGAEDHAMVRFGSGTQVTAEGEINAIREEGMVDLACSVEDLQALTERFHRLGTNMHTLFGRPSADAADQSNRPSRALISMGNNARISGTITATERIGGVRYTGK